MRKISHAYVAFMSAVASALTHSTRFSADVLKDSFSFINNRVNGYEHVLARRRGGKVHRGGGTTFSPKQRHGLRERTRRQEHMAPYGVSLLRGRHVQTGATALVRVTPGDKICRIQMDDRTSPQAYGWHEAPASLWEVVPVGTAGGLHTPKPSGPGFNHTSRYMKRWA